MRMKMICGQFQLLLYAQMGRDRDASSSALCFGDDRSRFRRATNAKISVSLIIITFIFSSLNACIREVFFLFQYNVMCSRGEQWETV